MTSAHLNIANKDTEKPRKYWSDLKKKLASEGYSEVSEKIGHLKLLACERCGGGFGYAIYLLPYSRIQS
ncbi:MAG: hypothetical protein AAB899_05070 [Patescibacteria group bacterium]